MCRSAEDSPMRSLEKLLGYIERKSPHRPGNIDDKDIFSSRDLGSFHLFRGLEHIKEEIFLISLVKEEPGFDLVSREAVPKDIIFVAAVLLGPDPA